MVMTDSGKWTWGPFIKQHDDLIDTHNDLVRRWNKIVTLIRQQNVGRPLDASEAQCAQVAKLRKTGKSLRGIAAETSFGLDTVRTIVDQGKGRDRSTKLHRARIEVDRQQRQPGSASACNETSPGRGRD